MAFINYARSGGPALCNCAHRTGHDGLTYWGINANVQTEPPVGTLSAA
jgi:hypothetical protein